MKLQALLQIFVLLSTTIIPNGHCFVTAGGCGCSSSQRADGTCCCSAGPSACCSTGKAAPQKGSCCSAKKPADTDETESASSDVCRRDRSDRDTATGYHSLCPCGGPASVAILLMPRIQTEVTERPGLHEADRLLACDQPDPGRLREAPAPPPPRMG